MKRDFKMIAIALVTVLMIPLAANAVEINVPFPPK